MYEKLFPKPKMTQKLLTKPPFRYLHDIYTATLGATNYANGLFQEHEMDGKEIKDKEAKINFLIKLITITEEVIGEKIDVKPTKIVAGAEPEKTNLFLQKMFEAATSGVDTEPYVKKLLNIGGEDDGGNDQQ